MFYRVDGADLETGEESYLVLQAATAADAEAIARGQGLLVAGTREASAPDWGGERHQHPAPASRDIEKSIAPTSPTKAPVARLQTAPRHAAMDVATDPLAELAAAVTGAAAEQAPAIVSQKPRVAATRDSPSEYSPAVPPAALAQPASGRASAVSAKAGAAAKRMSPPPRTAPPKRAAPPQGAAPPPRDTPPPRTA